MTLKLICGVAAFVLASAFVRTDIFHRSATQHLVRLINSDLALLEPSLPSLFFRLSICITLGHPRGLLLLLPLACRLKSLIFRQNPDAKFSLLLFLTSGKILDRAFQFFQKREGFGYSWEVIHSPS